MRIEVDETLDGLLIREYLKRNLGMSTTMIKHIKFAEKGILVNGERKNVRYTLRRGDILDLAMEDTEEEVSPYIIPAPLKVDIVYDDRELTIINKPYDMPSHPSRGHALDTVANALAYLHREEVYVFRPVNRLDRDTSGLMITANTRMAAYRMSLSMKEKKIHKVYVAVLEDCFPLSQGTHRSYIRRSGPEDLHREECDFLGGGKLALTAFYVLARNRHATLVLASPLTGRTHQLRVHFSSMGYPIMGDELYGNVSDEISRQALHAVSLEMPHPANGDLLQVASNLPEDICQLIRSHFTENAEELIQRAEHSFYSQIF